MTARPLRVALLGRAVAPIAIASLACSLALCARAETPDQVANPRTRDGTWVTDVPGALRDATRDSLNQQIAALERDTGIELGVAVVASLDGMSIEEFAGKLYEQWGIGKRSESSGALFLWSTGDRRVRIEVGYGLEPILTDGRAGSILDTFVLPSFKNDEFDQGVLRGVDAVVTVLRKRPLDLPPVTSDSYDRKDTLWPEILGFLFLGSASIFGWRWWRRYHPRRCKGCGATMKRLSETQDDSFLEDAQELEERIKSVDYDVWACPACAQRLVLAYPRAFSRHHRCPQCKNRTATESVETLHEATESSTGLERVTETCEYCKFSHPFTRKTPMVTASSSGSGSSAGGSSRSGGSSSFGGGRSGGGGASRGY